MFVDSWLRSTNSLEKTKNNVGTANKKLNLAASYFVYPNKSAAIIVTADLEEPGIRAKT